MRFDQEGRIELENRLLLFADVLTYHNDNLRTGGNLNETALTPANVNAGSFGKLGEVAVDGAIYAQPLIKTRVAIPGRGIRDVVYVATEHDSVYAFDADTLAPVWHDSFINPSAGITPLPNGDVRTFDILPEIGITGTPVIDPATSTLFVVSKIKISSPTGIAYDQQLHALDLATGAEKFGGPVDIRATVRGTGKGSARGKLSFNPLWELQRTALLLSNGTVYVAFASHSDNGPYHGWVLGYDARTLHQTVAFNDTPNGSEGGIWMSGGGPAADSSGFIYVSTGNGTFRRRGLKGDFGDSVLKLTPGSLTVADYFTPSDQRIMQALDLDLGSGGLVVLPDQPGPNPHLVVAGNKDGKLYLIDRDQMGRYSSRVERIVQGLPHAVAAAFDTPAYFNGTLYYVGTMERTATSPGGGDVLRAFSLANGRIVPGSTSPVTYGYPGSTPSVSANASKSGIVWTLDNGGASRSAPAILRASDANNVRHELYNSTQAGPRDAAGPAVKFTVPTVANGKVYVGGNRQLTLYGLRTLS
jgi:hypothetical protein